MSSEGLMSFLKSVVLLDVMEVIASDNNIAVHLGGNDNSPIK